MQNPGAGPVTACQSQSAFSSQNGHSPDISPALITRPDASPVGVIAAARQGEVTDDYGGAAGGITDVMLAGTERRRPFFAACGHRGSGVSVNV